MLGAMGTGKEEDRGLPNSVVVWFNSPSYFLHSNPPPPKLWELAPRAHAGQVGILVVKDTADPQIRVLAGEHQSRDKMMWKGWRDTELPCLNGIPGGWRKIWGLWVEPRHYSGKFSASASGKIAG